MNNFKSQGYDGASTMSGEKSGVLKRIHDKQQSNLYPLCRALPKFSNPKFLFLYRQYETVLIRLRV